MEIQDFDVNIFFFDYTLYKRFTSKTSINAGFFSFD